MKFYIELSMETVFPLSDFLKVLFFFMNLLKYTLLIYMKVNTLLRLFMK